MTSIPFLHVFLVISQNLFRMIRSHLNLYRSFPPSIIGSPECNHIRLLLPASLRWEYDSTALSSQHLSISPCKLCVQLASANSWVLSSVLRILCMSTSYSTSEGFLTLDLSQIRATNSDKSGSFHHALNTFRIEAEIFSKLFLPHTLSIF